MGNFYGHLAIFIWSHCLHWNVRMRQTVVVQKIRKIPIFVEMQFHTATNCVKITSCEWAFTFFSVTRIVEISLLWQNVTSLWQFVDGLFLILQNVNPILANFYTIGPIFIVANGQTLKNNLTIWSHCTLVSAWKNFN